MEEKSKINSGLNAVKIFRKTSLHFTESDKHQIIQELISRGCTKQEIWQKYTRQEEEHGQLLRWIRQLGYDDKIITRRPNFARNQIVMTKKKKPLK